MSEEEVRLMLSRLTIWPLVNGFTGRPALDVLALVKAIQGFVRMAQTSGQPYWKLK
jgi:hypothetical protein